MNPLVMFLLQQVGAPVVAMLIKNYQASHNNEWPTPEEVAQMFIDEPAKWIKQGNDWLVANPGK